MKKPILPARDFVLYRATAEIWRRGEAYADSGKIEILEEDLYRIIGIAHGTKDYNVSLAYRGGGISRNCDCPYFVGKRSDRESCKHLAGLTILWDEKRGYDRPTDEEVEEETIHYEEPLVSRAEINAMYAHPLTANLVHLRMASDSLNWTRPHARLPLKPKACDVAFKSIVDINKGLTEIKSWTRKYNFDMYFCAGEVIAGFCEIIRWIKPRLNKLLIDDQIAIIDILTNAHHNIVIGGIDDSDGGHIFSEAHLNDLIGIIEKQDLSPIQNESFELIKKKIKEY